MGEKANRSLCDLGEFERLLECRFLMPACPILISGAGGGIRLIFDGNGSSDDIRLD